MTYQCFIHSKKSSLELDKSQSNSFVKAGKSSHLTRSSSDLDVFESGYCHTRAPLPPFSLIRDFRKRIIWFREILNHVQSTGNRTKGVNNEKIQLVFYTPIQRAPFHYKLAKSTIIHFLDLLVNLFLVTPCNL